MTDYRKAKDSVAHNKSKYDGFKVVKTEHAYKHQKGSGRSVCFEHAKNGMLIGEWTKVCASKGYDSNFVIGSLVKLQGAAQPGWAISEKDANGRTFLEVKKLREESPERKEKREQRDADKETRKAEREAKKVEREKANAEKKAERKAKAEEKAAEKAAHKARDKQHKEAQQAQPVQ
jgi:hypothetical protein